MGAPARIWRKRSREKCKNSVNLLIFSHFCSFQPFLTIKTSVNKIKNFHKSTVLPNWWTLICYFQADSTHFNIEVVVISTDNKMAELEVRFNSFFFNGNDGRTTNRCNIFILFVKCYAYWWPFLFLYDLSFAKSVTKQMGVTFLSFVKSVMHIL